MTDDGLDDVVTLEIRYCPSCGVNTQHTVTKIFEPADGELVHTEIRCGNVPHTEIGD